MIEKKTLSEDEQVTLNKLIEKLNSSADKLTPMEETLIGLLNNTEQLASQVENHEKNIKVIEDGVEKFSKWIAKVINKQKTKEDDLSSTVAEAEYEETKKRKETKDVTAPVTASNEEANKKFTEMEERFKQLQELLSSQTQRQPAQTISEEQRKEFESARSEIANLRRDLTSELNSLKTQKNSQDSSDSSVSGLLLQDKLAQISSLQSQVSEMNTLVQQALTATRQPTIVSTPIISSESLQAENHVLLYERLSSAERRIHELSDLLLQRNIRHFSDAISEFPLSDNFVNDNEHSHEMEQLQEINNRLDEELQHLREYGRPMDRSGLQLLQSFLDVKLHEIEQLRQELLASDELLSQQADRMHYENPMNINTTDDSDVDDRIKRRKYRHDVNERHTDTDDEDSRVDPRQLRRQSRIQPRTPSHTRVPVKTPTIARPTITPQEPAAFGARVGKMQLGYDIIKMLEKKSKKPAVLVATAFNKQELLKKFDDFCESVTDKIERYNDDDVVGAVQQLNDIIQSKRSDAEKEKVLVNKLKTAKLGPVLYKDPEKDTENALQRFENKTNSVAIYNGLQAKRDPGNILTILKTDDADHPEPIVTISHEKPIDGPNFVEIICTNSHPEDRDIFVTINSARKLTKDGRFTVVGCDEPANPEAAMKLFIYGLSIGLKPRIQPATRKMIEEKRVDEQLFKIYTKYQDEGVGVVSQDIRNDIIADLKTYDSRKKKGGPPESRKASDTRFPRH